tara:strand:+ start:3302 stop:3601 length:300 start_codon:yes stop_codon:yes gene_type:complete
MKNTILTIATIGILFTSCTKEDELQPTDPCSSIAAFEQAYGEDITCGVVTRVQMSLIDGVQEFTVTVSNPCGVEYTYRYPHHVDRGNRVCETNLFPNGN